MAKVGGSRVMFSCQTLLLTRRVTHIPTASSNPVWRIPGSFRSHLPQLSCGLPPGIIDLCDESGTLKMFFITKTRGEYATKFLTVRNTYYVCKVQRGAPGTRIENSYRAIVPILKNPDPEMVDALRAQCETLERNRVKALKIIEAKRVAVIESTLNLSSKSGKSDDHSHSHSQSHTTPPRKGHNRGKVDFHPRRHR
ncbi:uncharacterized protein CXorf65 homolog isoform X1 [Octodon degus]|uniref:Uncharacterized protein CXorf65 homolog isoform X1 n=1 Tax=Octodon degus TaxID=10160 RepID=A0A6P6DSD2_OCTDE|nr:uncharacterized protein CXorf65 homolog isoform X1 [Octodon degus]